ncbi:MAG: class I SAM-dependent methyltransferase [Thermodesulfobacteriota bacterium]
MSSPPPLACAERRDGGGEAARIRRVYDAYRGSRAVRRRWDPANAGNRAIHDERAAALREILQRGGFIPFAHRRVLDLGCGSGEVLASLEELGALPEDLYGVDLGEQEIEAARRRFPSMHWQVANAETLEFQPGSFALVLAFTVFSSVLDDAMARNLAAEIDRVLHRDGALLWYDFRYRNPYNRAVRGISPRRIAELFPGWTSELRSITVLPPLSRRLGRAAPVLYPLLARVRPLRTHLIGLLRKPRDPASGEPRAPLQSELRVS